MHVPVLGKTVDAPSSEMQVPLPFRNAGSIIK